VAARRNVIDPGGSCTEPAVSRPRHTTQSRP
jgi:hypothetical protein